MKLRLVWLAAGLLLLALTWVFRDPLRDELFKRGTLANAAPPPELVLEMIRSAPDLDGALLAAWNSGKIVHRQVAVRELRRLLEATPASSATMEPLLLSAALDPDVSVREAALGTLAALEHPALPGLAAAQLKDCDPEIRALGLRYLKGTDPDIGLPLAAQLLDDPDLRVVGLSLNLMERWSGEDFGSRLSDTARVANPRTGLQEYQDVGVARVQGAVQRARAWLADQGPAFPKPQLPLPDAAVQAGTTLPAGDFQLRALDGSRVRLSKLRGRVVLLNFWTTWCPACLGEIPVLKALHEAHPEDLVVLGVSLDYVPDSHGHIGGHAAVEDQAHNHGHHNDDEDAAAARLRVRKKIERTVNARGVTYPILLDERNDVGGRYNGGELPTTVIIDPQGNIRRRFIGARSLPVFEAMVREAAGIAPAGRE
jgi:thiol-disulfide isomerase/thioredoxin